MHCGYRISLLFSLVLRIFKSESLLRLAPCMLAERYSVLSRIQPLMHHLSGLEANIFALLGWSQSNKLGNQVILPNRQLNYQPWDSQPSIKNRRQHPRRMALTIRCEFLQRRRIRTPRISFPLPYTNLLNRSSPRFLISAKPMAE